MNVFIFVDISKQFIPEANDIKYSQSFSQSGTDDFKIKNNTSLVGIGGFRNRRITFMNHAAILNGIRYGECWNPRTHRDVICLSKREVSQANKIFFNIYEYITSILGPCDQREKGFFWNKNFSG